MNTNTTSSLSFAELLASRGPVTPVKGQILTGTYLGSGLIDFGGKSDGRLHSREVGDCQLAVGQTAQFLVVGQTDDDELDFGKDEGDIITLSHNAALAWEQAGNLHTSRETVLGKVTRVVRGGLRVSLPGIHLRAFLPLSLLAQRRRLDDLVGEEVPVKVVTVEPSGRGLVVDNRACASELKDKRRDLIASLATGEVVSGTVRSVMPYGYFVEFAPGTSGLLHKSEVPQGITLSQGDRVECAVVKTNPDKGEVGLSMKRCAWARLPEKLSVGDTAEGIVRGIAEYGCFVELVAVPGVQGLLHKSRMSRAVAQGEKVTVKVHSMKVEELRLGLSLVS